MFHQSADFKVFPSPNVSSRPSADLFERLHARTEVCLTALQEVDTAFTCARQSLYRRPDVGVYISAHVRQCEEMLASPALLTLACKSAPFVSFSWGGVIG